MQKIIPLIIILVIIASFAFVYRSGFITNGSESNNSVPITSTIPSQCHVVNGLPDPKCTPGATKPEVMQGTIYTTICLSGYSKSVRPPQSYTTPLKTQLMQSYGFIDSKLNYELDHLIPLEIGGAPYDVKNLWPEPRGGEPNAGEKDKFESYLHDQVCSGSMSLSEAQKEIATNWFYYWSKAGRP